LERKGGENLEHRPGLPRRGKGGKMSKKGFQRYGFCRKSGDGNLALSTGGKKAKDPHRGLQSIVSKKKEEGKRKKKKS